MNNMGLKRWIPPALRELANGVLRAATVYEGPFSTWDAAANATTGYDEAAILDRVTSATGMVLDGRASYEQDGIAFHEDPAPQHALYGLLLASTIGKGRLSVLDFGGGLASHYLRWRPWVSQIPELRWTIVEQEAFVAAGRRLFCNDSTVSFYKSIADIPSEPNAILASSVLQYLSDPYATLEQLAALPSETVVIDRTPFSRDDEDQVFVQNVPASLGKASYPCWMLSRSRVHAIMRRRYRLLCEFDSPDSVMRVRGRIAKHQGSIWVLRS